MSDGERQNNEENRQLYAEYAKEINSRTLYNIENYDKAILSLSTTILGLSLAFIKDIVPFDKVDNHVLLYWSWTLFIGAIVCIVLSFITGIKDNEKHLEFAEDYYLNDNDEAFKKKSRWSSVTEWLNNFSGFFFVLGIICTVLFVGQNLNSQSEVENIDTQKKQTSIEQNSTTQNRESQMSDKAKVIEQKQPSNSGKERIDKGAPAPSKMPAKNPPIKK